MRLCWSNLTTEVCLVWPQYDIFLPRLLAELHSDSWYLRFCFKTILKLMRRMLVALLDTVKESPATLAAVDRFMRDEVRRSWIYIHLH